MRTQGRWWPGLLVALVVASLWGAVRPATAAGAQAAPAAALAELTPQSEIAGFRAHALYLDDLGQPRGARLKHLRTGLILDVLYFESAPQLLISVNTPPTSDKGEPHVHEHVVLGKGNVGRSLMNACEMNLVATQAATFQWYTNYHFHVVTGDEAFYQMTEQHLNALVHPDMTDEEIRREVCHLGVTSDGAGGPLRLEEKGTIYAEMVNYEAQPWRIWRYLSIALYGPEHPLARESGGLPADLREVTPADVRLFHDRHYTLGNMTLIAALHPGQALPTALERFDAILRRVQPGPTPVQRSDESTFPPPQPAPPGQIQIVDYPQNNDQQPGPVLLGWLGPMTLEPKEQLLLELFADTIADGETSNLYKRLVDTTTRVMDVGATSVSDQVSRDPGHPTIISIDGVSPPHMTSGEIGRLREVVRSELRHVAALPAGARELADFNSRLRVRLLQRRRSLSKLVNSPPLFGFRDTDDTVWLEQLRLLDHTTGFRKQLTLKPETAFVGAVLAAKGNPWGGYLRRWKLLDTEPYAVAARPNPDLLTEQSRAEAARLASAVERLKRQYGVTDDQQAITRLKADYDAATAQLERQTAETPLPPLPATLPMALDGPLNFHVAIARGRIPIVSSTFESTTSATVGLALSVSQVPREQLVYLALLPQLLTSVGLYENGKVLTYDQMQEQLRREILGLNAAFTSNSHSGRCELMLKGAGNDAAESQRAVEWMQRVLQHPYWSAENLPRLRGVVDQALSDLRQRPEGYAESWVDEVGFAYRVQDKPAFLTTGSIFTRMHQALRLRWLLKDVPAGPDAAAVTEFLKQLAAVAHGARREDLKALLACLQDPADEAKNLPPNLQAVCKMYAALPEKARTLAGEVAGDLGTALSDTPDANLEQDWAYLCREMLADLMTPPAQVLAGLQAVRGSLLRTGGARVFVVGSSANQARLAGPLSRLLAGLRQSPAVRPETPTTPVVVSRLREREPQAQTPIFVGLVMPAMQGSVIIADTRGVGLYERDSESLLRFLALNLFAGGGAKSLFGKTWNAGLAYSNGISARPEVSRFSYYADQAPDLPHLLSFLHDELKNAPRDPALADYAIVETFSSRAADAYEARGEQIAADLADGVTPGAVRRFREAVLAMRQRPNLAEALYDHMLPVYGQVLPGPDVKLAALPGSQYLTIGAAEDLTAYEGYLKAVQGPETRLYRLYPRDFWLVGRAGR